MCFKLPSTIYRSLENTLTRLAAGEGDDETKAIAGTFFILYGHVYVCMCVCVCVYVYVCICVYVCMCVCVCMCICVYVLNIITCVLI